MKILKRSAIGLSFLIALLCSACDKVVKSEYQKIGEPYIGETECTTPGFCMDCALSFDGKYDCMPRFKPNCRGIQPAIMQDVIKTNYYESGEVSEHQYSEVLQVTGSCA